MALALVGLELQLNHNILEQHEVHCGSPLPWLIMKFPLGKEYHTRGPPLHAICPRASSKGGFLDCSVNFFAFSVSVDEGERLEKQDWE